MPITVVLTKAECKLVERLLHAEQSHLMDSAARLRALAAIHRSVPTQMECERQARIQSSKAESIAAIRAKLGATRGEEQE